MVQMVTTDSKSVGEKRTPQLRFRISLRSWFVILSLICVGIVLGNYANQRSKLEKAIVEEGTLIYHDSKRHQRPTVQADGGGLISQTIHLDPSPVVRMRDSFSPWLGQKFEGSPIVCRFDSIEYHVDNVPTPMWVNDVLSSGELRWISLRVNRPETDIGLVMKNLGLVELELMGTSYDRHALEGIHRLEKLEALSIYSGFDISFEKLIADGLPANLKSLFANHCEFESSDIAALKTCRVLEDLTLMRGNFNLQELAEVGLPKTLKKVDFYDSKIAKSDFEILAACPLLVSVALGGSEVDLREMDGITTLDSVELLDIRGAMLDASTFRWLSRLSRLKDLNIRDCRYNDEDAKDIVLSPTLVSYTCNDMNRKSHVNIMFDNTLRLGKQREEAD